MRRIEILREVYLPAFLRLRERISQPIAAGCEISEGLGCKIGPPNEHWRLKAGGFLLQNKPPTEGMIFWDTRTADASTLNSWYYEAQEAAAVLGDWLIPMGVDERVFRPRWPGAWFSMFKLFGSSRRYPFPMQVVCVGKVGKFGGTSERIVVDDLIKATILAIQCLIEVGETIPKQKPGPSQASCPHCGFTRDCDPYCPPTVCVNCGKPLQSQIHSGAAGKHDRKPKGRQAENPIADSQVVEAWIDYEKAHPEKKRVFAKDVVRWIWDRHCEEGDYQAAYFALWPSGCDEEPSKDYCEKLATMVYNMKKRLESRQKANS